MNMKNKTMKKSLVNKFQRAMVSLAVAGMIFGSMPITAMAAEPTEVTTEVTTEAEAQSVETVANDNVETTETTSPSVEDLLNGATNTDEVVEEETFVDLTIKASPNTIIEKDGVVLTSYEDEMMLEDGILTLSQPTAEEYKERLESDVTVTIENSDIKVEFLGQDVEGCITDELGNSVIYMDNTLEIINADKMADVIPEEDEDDQPDNPDEVPTPVVADYTVRYFINSVADENFLGSYNAEGTEGVEINVESINLNLYKPVDTETLIWADGAIQDGAATVVTADDTDIIDIVYVSETVVVETPADYTIRYFKNEVADANLLGTINVEAVEGAEITTENIDLNKFKPVDGEGLVWVDGTVVFAATVVTTDDTDVIDIVYVSETVVTEGNASFTVQYYKDDLVEGNFLGQYEVAATDGTNIDYSTIDVNKFQPENYGNGDIQTVVSAKVVTSDNTDIVYVLYTAVETETKVITETIVEKETETVYVTLPGEVITETVEVEKIVEVEVPGEEKVVYIEGEPEVITETIIEKEYVYIYVDEPSDDDDDSSTSIEENPDPETDEDNPDEYEDGPQTGDMQNILLYVVAAFISLIGIIAMVILAIRKKNTTN